MKDHQEGYNINTKGGCQFRKKIAPEITRKKLYTMIKEHDKATETVLNFLHGVSVLFMKNSEEPSEFKDKYQEMLYEWLHEGNMSESLFLVQDLENSSVSVVLTLDSSKVGKYNALMILKNQSVIEPEMPIESQLSMIMLQQDSQFDTLKALVDVGVNQIFNRILSSKENTSKIVPDSLLNTKRKIRDLSISLQNLDKGIQIPDIESSIHPIVKEIVNKGANAHNIGDFLSTEQLNDSSFLNELQKTSNQWIKSVHSLLRLENNLYDGSALDEVDFWRSYYGALSEFEERLNSTEVDVTMSILASAKRYYRSSSLSKDTGLNKIISESQDYYLFLNALGIPVISSASTLVDLSIAIDTFTDEFKRLRIIQYPLEKAVKLVEKVSDDISAKIRELLPNLLLTSYEEFLSIVDEAVNILNKWDEKLKSLTLLIRELMRKRSEKFIFLRFTCSTDSLKASILKISSFRSEHHKLLETIDAINRHALLERLTVIYDSVKSVNPLTTDTSSWRQIEQSYYNKITILEDELINILHKELENCKTSKEMFQIFEKYKPLMERDRVLNAVREYQHQLLFNVKSDILLLKDTVIKQKPTKVSNIGFDVQPIIQEIVWQKKILKKVHIVTSKLTAILGPEWDQTTVGSEISKECISIETTLDTNKKFETWINEAEKRSFILEQSIFKIVRSEFGYELKVNFDFSAGSLFKTVRNLIWQGYVVPSDLIRTSRITRNMYPHAIISNEKVRTFLWILHEMTSLVFTKPLLHKCTKNIWRLLSNLINEPWENILSGEASGEGERDNILIEFESAVDYLLEQFEYLRTVETEIKSYFKSLRQLPLTVLDSNITDPLQKIADQVLSKNYGFYSQFFGSLNDGLKDLLIEKYTDLVHESAVETMYQSIVFSNTSFQLSPSFFSLKSYMVRRISSIANLLLKQHKIVDTRYANAETASTFSDLLCDLQPAIEKFLLSIEDLRLSSAQCLNKWKSHEYLWSLTEEQFIVHFGHDIDACIHFMSSLIKQRVETSSLSSTLDIGNQLFINQEKALLTCISKFDQWQQFGLKHLLSLYINLSVDIHHSLSMAKKTVEESTLHFSSLKTVTDVIIYLDTLESELERTELQFLSLKDTQKLLIQTRTKLPSDFIYCEQLKVDIDSLTDICAKKQSQIGQNRHIIANKVETETERLKIVSESLISDWEDKKPTSSSTSPSEALEMILSFEESINEITKQTQNLLKITKLLLIPVSLNIHLDDVLTEVINYKSMWSSVDKLWNSLQTIVQEKWHSITLSKVKSELNELSNSSNSLPPVVLQYSVFQNLLQSIQSILSTIPILMEMKAADLQTKHWRHIFDTFDRPDISTDTIQSVSFTLMDILSLNLSTNENDIHKIINQAKDEKVLASTLEEIKDRSKDVSIQIFLHESGQKLIRNWSALFSSTTDDINTLLSMKNSQYYKIFEQEIYELETKLTEFSSILTCGLEIQRQWCYLYGVLNSKSPLKNLLPTEASRFSNLTSDLNILFTTLIQSNSALDVISNPDYYHALKALSDSLTKVRKSLHDFLESQRALFPRFYFIGNEDLLQLIGSTTDLAFLSNQMSKMFGAVGRVEVLNNSIVSVCSIEGESLNLDNTIPIDPTIPTYQWMRNLDKEIKLTLARLVKSCLDTFSLKAIPEIFKDYPFQIIWLCMLIEWTKSAQSATSIELQKLEEELSVTINEVSKQKTSQSARYQYIAVDSLISEMLNLRNITQALRTTEDRDSSWNEVQKFYFNDNNNVLDRVTVVQGGIIAQYGFEYIGVPETLVHTPTLQTFFATIQHALANNLGGSPFGPAGTGKTESVKYLGKRLGRFVLVFNCDDTFDFRSMSRILFGIAQIGAWGCFDEFNRLTPEILSAVSSQIEEIQSSMLSQSNSISILDRTGDLHPNTGIFITMNLGYSGRSQLPGNLKRMFRDFAMDSPQSLLILETLLNIMGFSDSKEIAKQLVAFFEELGAKTSTQPHYDFGLRALKAVIRNCNVSLMKNSSHPTLDILLESVRNIITPKLLESDELIFEEIWSEHFPTFTASTAIPAFENIIKKFCKEEMYVFNEEFYKKCEQLYEIQKSQQGIILVGEAGCGKTSVLKGTLEGVEELSAVPNIIHTIDSKALSKEELYGHLDPVTFEWQDGVFTSILRDINGDYLGEYKSCNIWIIFDSELDPIYAETLNSVLDDNKVFTLPNGERLKILENIHIIFEVENLAHATLATVSRCGMLWINSNMIQPEHVFSSCYKKHITSMSTSHKQIDQMKTNLLRVSSLILSDINLHNTIEESQRISHIMGFDIRRISTTYSKLLCENIASQTSNIMNMAASQIDIIFMRYIALALLWAFPGDCNIADKIKFSLFIAKMLEPYGLSQLESPLLNYEISPKTGEFVLLDDVIEEVELESHQVLSPELIIPTMDTYRHEQILFSLLRNHQPLILCGPPGSGKTMTLHSALKRSEDHDIIGMNFSKDTTVESFLNTIEQHTAYKNSSEGLILQPLSFGKQLVVFCDEINLPQQDAYGSQPIILFLRQLVEKNGFWSLKEKKWVSLKRIQIVAACNPATDAGRSKLTNRFTRHTSVLMVDYPAKESLVQIYLTFFKAVLKLSPSNRNYANNFANASVDLYYRCKEQFVASEQVHYIFSPRELTRWVRGVHQALQTTIKSDLDYILKIWAYEARRIFSDRLISDEEKDWFEYTLLEIASSQFPLKNISDLVDRSITFCSWINMDYEETDISKIRAFVSERLKTFCEEVLNYDVVLHDQMIRTMLNVDKVMKQVQGHAMIVAPTGSGKSTITKFVAWMNGIEVNTLNIHRNFSLSEFDEFLRKLLIKCGVENRKCCLILDESSMIETSFVERLNTLLANSDIPGLFQAEEFDALMSKIRTSPHLPGNVLDNEQSLYEWFTEEISKNLHVVMNISDPQSSSSTRIMTSPALFNRCVLTWMGEWSEETLSIVARHFTEKLPFDQITPSDGSAGAQNDMWSIVSQIFCETFKEYHHQNGIKSPSPSLFLNSLRNLRSQYIKKLKTSDENQRFIRNGLTKLKETLLTVKQLNKEMEEKKDILHKKEMEARKTLDQMLHDQNEAERKQEASIQIQKILDAQELEISKRRDIVMRDLETARPAILEAQSGVKNIKKQQLVELRTMHNPPEAVKTTLEAVCVLLGFRIESWKDIQQTIRKDDFIARIVTFNTETMLPEELKEFIKSEYLSRVNFKYENVQRASQACGPLYLWVVAQIQYSDVLLKVEPLQADLEVLETEIMRSRAKSLAADEMISELQNHIEKSKESYSQIIRDIEVLKSEMNIVEAKVSKSVTLLDSLSSEKERWTLEIKQFAELKKNLLGDSILESLYTAYCYSHDYKMRMNLIDKWKSKLSSQDISFDHSFKNLVRNANPEAKAKWIDSGLSDDDFAVETFFGVIDSESEKYPLIVDPEGNILDVLYGVYEDRLVATSFLDENFSKILKNTLRFGGVLLIQDGEFYDPFISRVLSQEFQEIGGRKTITLDDSNREVDVSKDFRMIMYTRDKDWIIPDYIKTKCQLFNFTITKGNLESQTLQYILANELPELQHQRNMLLEKSVSYKLKLHELEKKLLELLNTSNINILENDDLLQTLENLKRESQTTQSELSSINIEMHQQKTALTEFTPLSVIAVKIFEIMEWLRSKKHWFYDVDVKEFLVFFQHVFEEADQLTGEMISRPAKICVSMLRLMFCAFGSMLSEDDRILFATRLFELYMISEESINTVETWKKIRSNIDYMTSAPELPDLFDNFKQGLIGGDPKDGLTQMILSFMKDSPWSLNDFFSKSSSSKIVLVGAGKGVDGSLMIKKIAEQSNKDLTIIAMGSTESCIMAEETLGSCMDNGGWILLQNIQMSFVWCNEVLPKYLKKISSNSHPDFQLFLTCSLQDSIHPTSQLLQYCTKITYEGESGVLHNIKKFWSSVTQNLPETGNVVYLKHLICWIHALILERVRVTSQNAEYHDLDLQLAINSVDSCVKKEIIDWHKLRFIVGKVIYSNRLNNNDELYAWIQNLTFSILHENSFKPDSSIIADIGSPNPKHSTESITSWLHSLPWTLEQKDKWLSIPKQNLESKAFTDTVTCMQDLTAIDNLLQYN